MKKIGYVFGVITLVFLLLGLNNEVQAADKGGIKPCLGSCCLGPRVGLEMNEGEPIRTEEWMILVPYVGPFIYMGIAGSAGYEAAGPQGCLANICIGPRVGTELKERKIRTMEWMNLLLAPIPNIIMAAEAYDGKTMTEIATEENLNKK